MATLRRGALAQQAAAAADQQPSSSSSHHAMLHQNKPSLNNFCQSSSSSMPQFTLLISGPEFPASILHAGANKTEKCFLRRTKRARKSRPDAMCPSPSLLQLKRMI
jgi:hypothetical protein